MDLAREIYEGDEQDSDDVYKMQEITRLLKEQSFWSELVMLTTPNRPMAKSNNVVCIFLLMMLITLTFNILLTLSMSLYYTLGFIILLVSLDAICFIRASQSDQIYIKKNQDLEFINLLETFDSESLCPTCEVIRLPRSRHCNICNKCVDRYDHHCPWINNCVGKSNHLSFFFHLVLIVIYCLTSVIVSIQVLCAPMLNEEETAQSSQQLQKHVEGIFVIVNLSLGVVFGILVGILLVY